MKDNNTIKLSSLGLLPKPEIKTIKCGDAEVQVATFIPYEDIFDLIQWCIGYIAVERPFISEPVRRLILDFAILKYYTNLDISFINDEARVADVYAEYDVVKQMGVVDKVIECISKEQFDFIEDSLNKTLKSLIAYKNSAMGIVEALSANAEQDTVSMQAMVEAVQQVEEDSPVGELIKFVSEAKAAPPQE